MANKSIYTNNKKDKILSFSFLLPFLFVFIGCGGGGGEGGSAPTSTTSTTTTTTSSSSSTNTSSTASEITTGILDTDFANVGYQTYNNGNKEYGYDIAIDSSGNILVAGEIDTGASTYMAVWKYDTSGNLVTSFDTDGVITVNGTTVGMTGTAIAIDSNDKIYVSGDYNSTDAVVCRFLDSNGSLDTTFTATGCNIFGTVTIDEAKDIFLDNNGSIYVSGVANDDAAIFKLHDANGSLDTSFNADGLATFSGTGGGYDSADALAVTSSGEIYFAGTAYVAGKANFLIAKADSNGTLDNTFGGSGSLTYTNGSSDYATDLAIDSDENIYVAGYYKSGSYNNLQVKALDKSGNSIGNITYNGGYDDKALGITLDSNQNLYVTGISNSSSSTNMIVLKYNSAYNLDTSFNGTGYRTYDSGSLDAGIGIVLDSSKNPYITGYVNGTSYDMAIWKLK